MKLSSFQQLTVLKSKMDHQVLDTQPLTMNEKMKNFRASSAHLSPKNKGKMFMRTFASR